MKLTKIEVYEIQAFAFRVMTGYMAPGKDASPLADETPYEGRCAAWDEWRNEHGPCILAMLHGFEALIDRDDGTTRALRAELAECKQDAERYRWLRRYHIRSDPDMSGRHHWMTLGRGIGRGATAEEAIDAARNGEGEA